MKELQDRWECCVALEVTYHDSFKEAFKKLYKETTDMMKNSGLTWQVLETAIWIKDPKEKEPMMFYEARDKACRDGLVKDGKLTE